MYVESQLEQGEVTGLLSSHGCRNSHTSRRCTESWCLSRLWTVHETTRRESRQHLFFHLRRLRQVRRRVGKDITIRLVLEVIMSWLDYCNSVLAGLPQSTLQPLQRVQDAAARLICDVPYHEHITPHLRELHWLPVRSRIEYKLCLTMYNVHNGRRPSYLSDMFQPADTPSRPLRLRSADSSSYVKPRLRTKFGEQAFSHSGPAAWNQFQSTPDNCRISLCFQART